jgi:signal transduction histidine kinase
LSAIKQLPELREVPFVFLTAQAERSDQRDGMALGADDYITKPFFPSDILDAIAARTDRQDRVRERLAEQHQREIHAPWSHELLTPLNAILGTLDLLEAEADTIDRGELRKILATMRTGAEQQERLARKLIRYFELEQLLQRPERFQVGRCQADSAIEVGGMRAAGDHRRKHRLTISAQPGTVAVHEEFLAYAIFEVVENAFKFSPAGSPVTVSGASQTDRYRIEIADQGAGLSAEQRGRMGAFTQFDRPRREQQGLGLGLAIARATAKLAGGNLLLEAGPAKNGLNVVFDLPRVEGAAE